MPYVGEIRMFAGSFEPNGWLFCRGQSLAILDYETLFQLIGTTYGGDGESTFNLPNLASRIPLHMGTGPDGTSYALGEMGGTEQETLTVQRLPAHSHPLIGTGSVATTRDPVPGNAFAIASGDVYNEIPDLIALHSGAVGNTGGSQPHENMQPFVVINFIISLFGVFPSPT